MADIIPVKSLTTEDVLYGDRNTSYRWEVLEHSNGVDYLIGTLDGVSDGALRWVQNAAVKGSGKLEVVDLDVAQPGMLRIADLELESCRLRPVMTLNSMDRAGHYEETWTEQARNMMANPIPATTSGWSAPAGVAITADGFTATNTTTTTPYIFSAAIATGETIVAGRWYAFRATVRVYAAPTSIFNNVSVRPHKNVGNVYYGVIPGGIPTVAANDIPTEVAFYWQAPADIPQSDAFNLSIVGNGTGVSGSKYSMKSVVIADAGTTMPLVSPQAFFSGASVSSVPYRRFRWLGLTNNSASVAEVRTVQWVNDGPLFPEVPWGTFLLEKAGEEWDDTGRVWSLSMLDRCTVPSQDAVDQSYSLAAGTLILQQVRTILASCGEYIGIDESNALITSSGMVWEAGTSKLKIINDLLDVANYNSLWMDGWGNLQATPRVLPANRSILYELLGVPRVLQDGEKSIYTPEWTRDRDSFKVPNKVIAVQAAGGEDVAALVGQWTNDDPDSPYSYTRRGRWITHTLDSVDTPEGTDAEIIAFLQARARATLVSMSAVQSEVKVEHLPIPVRVSDVLRFANTRAGVDARHVITSLELETSSTGLMKSTLQEVISL